MWLLQCSSGLTPVERAGAVTLDHRKGRDASADGVMPDVLLESSTGQAPQAYRIVKQTSEYATALLLRF